MSNHPNFPAYKNVQLKTIQPGVREGWLKKRGFKAHTWKRRYFVIKNNFIFYFPSSQPDSTPKGMIELNSKSQAKLLDQTFLNIVVTSVHRDQYIIAETPDIGASWVDAINNQIRTLKKIEDQGKDDEKRVAPTKGIPSDVMSEIARIREENDDKVPPSSLTKLIKNVGDDTMERYLYSILSEVLRDWDNKQIGRYFYSNFCRNYVRVDHRANKRRMSLMKTGEGKADKVLSDLNLCFGGVQRAVLGAYGAERENDQDELMFVFGKTKAAGERLADIYKTIIAEYSIGPSEVIRTIFDAMETWKMRTDEEIFLAFVGGMMEGWGPELVASFVSLLFVYTKEQDSFPLFETPWVEMPDHALLFIKRFIKAWSDCQKAEFFKIGRLLWGVGVDNYKAKIESLQ
ncbi:hypothetical protein EIN_168630 [Entamoeba invadens IP1]|uniref:PH domain-containing protein n=1 Tax=Entamoeba invadens IP1 TaxID=370355 RepID=A0A0A1U0R1_ENTIV|nr:hypothetical protein EIN_168630 [Entamoeba invadens IP1]ELP84468.1 hypothetical protein EIN_168630 [Entamoeba invadens IP1]|eukprot:XP_004183814.1 hypothetical protein EIN_168630 [Entamoeba invadens IP1]